MTLTAQARLLTAEEFSRLPQPPDGTLQELVKGTIITMPPPGMYHGRVCLRAGRRLGNYIEDNNLGWITCNDSGVILSRHPDTVRGPDLAYWSIARLPDPPREGYPSIVPDLVVEVMSPSDVFTRVQQKVEQYLDAGVRLVWVFVPEDRSVAVFRADRRPRLLFNGDALDGEDVLPGFACPVAEMFP